MKRRAVGNETPRMSGNDDRVGHASSHGNVGKFAGPAVSAATADVPRASPSPARWANTPSYTSPCRGSIPGRPYKGRFYRVPIVGLQDTSSVSKCITRFIDEGSERGCPPDIDFLAGS
jgi:hypothetical protein